MAVVPEQRPASRWDTLLAWPTRLFVVAGTTLVGWIWAKTPGGVQLGWALQYGLIIAVSIVTSFWMWILGVNLIVAGAWVLLAREVPGYRAPDDDHWELPDFVTWGNRQIEHIEVMATWVAVALIWSPNLTKQLLRLAVVIFLGAPFINGLARTRWFGGDSAKGSRAALIMERRSVIYLATLVGMLLLASRAPLQWRAIGPLFLGVLPGLALRWVRFQVRKQLDGSFRGNRLAHADLQARTAHLTAWIGPTIVAAFFGLVAGGSLWQRHRLAVEASAGRDGPPPPADACAQSSGGPLPPMLGMFLLADTQIHELGGTRFPGQMEVADALVPVARRPVELDMLSSAAIVNYQGIYRGLVQQYDKGLLPDPGHPRYLARPLWAHLGDFSDLSCSGEMDRMLALLHGFGGDRPLLAGVAPGNHDSAFTGNFAWSPYWDTACVTPRMDKTASDDLLEKKLLTDADLVKGANSQALSGWFAPARLFSTRLSRFTVTPLGAVPLKPAGTRGVVGIFVDTSDRFARDFGIAGSFGTFSERQEQAILQAVAEVKAKGDPWADPWFVLFGHIPYDELTPWSRDTLDHLIETLDGRGGDDRAAGGYAPPRVIGLITAHTHTAESHRHCVGQRLVREIVVGSVIDPPQQASLLEIGVDERGRGAARLSTLPAVARAGLTCSTENTIPAGACRRAMAALAAAPECQDLVDGVDSGDGAGASCESLERPLTLDEQVAGIVEHGGPQKPAELGLADEKRARALLACVCRKNPAADAAQKITVGQSPPPTPPPPACSALEPLVGEAYAPAITELARDPDRRVELACLSWAASALQRHKAAGMTMADAIRCAFDDPTLPPAQVTVAVAEDVSCY